MHRSISNNFTTHTRYSYQAQEMDNEIKGEGNSVNYKYRMHDPRLGRFFALDPLFKDYPANSSFAFSENNVIHCVELEGLEKVERYKPTVVTKPVFSKTTISCMPRGQSKPLSVATEDLKTYGTIASFSGAVVTVAGIICNAIPTPQTQAAGKLLVPAGEALDGMGTAMTLTALAIEKDGTGFVKEVGLGAASSLAGGVVDVLFDAGKINVEDVQTMNVLIKTEEPLVGELMNSNKSTPKKSNPSNFKSTIGKPQKNPIESSPMYNWVKSFQNDKSDSKSKSSSKTKKQDK